MCSLYNMHELNPFDEFWLYEKAPNQLGNTTGLYRFNKFKFETFKDFMYREFCMKIQKTKCVLTQVFGKFYWQELTQE